jgi:hypothetical protein
MRCSSSLGFNSWDVAVGGFRKSFSEFRGKFSICEEEGMVDEIFGLRE